MKRRHVEILFSVVCSTGLVAHAFAADEGTPAGAADSTTLEEIVVTAERRTSDIQSTAASVSVRTGAELAAQGKYSTRQILEDIPGLTAVDNSSVNVGSSDVQGNNIIIRGITNGNAAGAGASPSGISPTPGVAVYVDGVYEGVGSAYDLDRVELLRGPQGTLYGRSATSGVVAFHTRNPTFDGIAGNAAVEAGNYDLKHYTAAVNIPLSDVLAVRVSGDYRDQGKAYFDQPKTGGMATSTNGRAKLLWKPNDAFSLLVGVAYAKNDTFSGHSQTTTDPTNNLVETTTFTDKLFPAHKVQRQYWAEANWDVGPVTITYLPAFRSWEQNDNVLVQAHFLGGARDLNQNFKTPKDDFNTHELRIASKDDATVKWQGGVFYYDNKLSNTNHNFLVNSDGTEFVVESDTSDTRSTTSLGYFAETTIPFTDSLRTTLGARYDNTKVAVTELYYENPDSQCGLLPFAPVGAPSPSGSGAICTGVSQSTDPFPPHTPFDKTIKKSNFNYKARLEFDLTQKNMMYGMISTGFRPGDAQVVTRRDPPNPTVTAPNVVEPEKLTAIEIGSKNRFFDDSLQVNVSLYAYRYQGFATSYKQSASSFSGIPITVPARNLGSELELLYQLTSHDRVGLNYSYTESRWYDKPAVFAAAQPEKKRAGTPHIVTANYEHVFNLPGGSTLSTRIDGKYESSHLTTNLHAGYVALGYEQYVYAKAQTIGNLNGTWSSNGGRYGVSAYVRNFADVKYTSIVNFGGLLSQQTVNWNDPRTYGVILSAKF